MHSHRNIIFIFVLVLLSSFFCFYKLGKPSIRRWDEQTNKSVVEQINRSNNFSMLKKDSGEYFFEKPPLWYDITAITTQLLGESNFSLRFISALSAFVLIIGTTLFMLKEYSLKSAIFTSLTFFSVVQLYFFSPGQFFSTHTFRSADLDALQMMLIVLSTIGYSYYLKGSRKMGYMASILSGLALMAKGPLGITPLILLLLFLAHKRTLQLHIRPILKFLGIVLIVSAPWYILMAYKFSNTFVYEHFGYQIIDRVLVPLEGHSQPFWHYIYMLLTGKLAPNILLLLPLSYTQIKRLNELKFISWVSLAFIVIYLPFISLMQTKLAWYLLPLYPFMAILIGDWANNFHLATIKRKLQLKDFQKNYLQILTAATITLPLFVYTAINICALLKT